MKQNVYFVSGIDTDAGKSYATGYLAREWNKNGKRTITQKFIQTGNVLPANSVRIRPNLSRSSFGIRVSRLTKYGHLMKWQPVKAVTD